MGINEKTGEVFSVAAENAPVAGCTVSKAVAEVAGGYVAHFSLAAGTDISPETYSAPKVWLVASGEGEAFTADGREWPLKAGDAFTIVTGTPIGYEGAEHVIKAGENFKFAKNGRHWVKANGRFKMALLLVID